MVRMNAWCHGISLRLALKGHSNKKTQKSVKKTETEATFEIMSSTEAPDPIFRRRWPIIITFFIFASNNAFQYVEIWFASELISSEDVNLHSKTFSLKTKIENHECTFCQFLNKYLSIIIHPRIR